MGVPPISSRYAFALEKHLEPMNGWLVLVAPNGEGWLVVITRCLVRLTIAPLAWAGLPHNRKTSPVFFAFKARIALSVNWIRERGRDRHTYRQAHI